MTDHILAAMDAVQPPVLVQEKVTHVIEGRVVEKLGVIEGLDIYYAFNALYFVDCDRQVVKVIDACVAPDNCVEFLMRAPKDPRSNP